MSIQMKIKEWILLNHVKKHHWQTNHIIKQFKFMKCQLKSLYKSFVYRLNQIMNIDFCMIDCSIRL